MGQRGTRAQRFVRTPVLNSPPLTRTFIACWPEPELARRFGVEADRLRERVGGRRVATANLHMTLAFLGGLTASQIQAVTECCSPMPREFSFTLDRVGFFKGRNIVWLGAREVDPEFVRFVEDLRDRLRRVGFRVERRPFTPHLTLLRKATRRPRLAIDDLAWTVGEYTLTASELTRDGASYSALNRWSTIGDVK